MSEPFGAGLQRRNRVHGGPRPGQGRVVRHLMGQGGPPDLEVRSFAPAEGVPEDFILQEYMCSFTRGAEGSYYGKLIQKARDENRICDLPIIGLWRGYNNRCKAGFLCWLV
mgnify:CR=1 FL=1